MGPLAFLVSAAAALLAFTAFTLVCLVGPGLALQRVFRLPTDPALVLPLGGAATAGCYWFSMATGVGWLFPVSIVLLLGPLLRRSPLESVGPSLRGALAPFALVLLVLAATVYPLHRIDGLGRFLLDGEAALAADTAFHVGVTHELTLGHPPQVPGLAGFPLSYHLGTDLVRAAALRWAGVPPYDSINRLDVTLWAFGLVLALRGAAQVLGGPPFALGLAGFTLLAGDFSFLFAGNPQAHWWIDLLRGNVLLSLAYANPVIPGLTLALGSVIAFRHHEEDGRKGWLVLAGVLAFAVAFFKVFLGAQLATGLLTAAVLRRSGGAAAAGVAAAVSTGLLAMGSGASGVALSFAPLDLVRVTRETLALPALGAAPLAAWSALWLFASVGLRWIGIAPAVGALRGEPSRAALAVMALSGWPLGLLFKVAPPDAVAGQRPINDASFLVEQSGPLLWLFAAMALARLAERRPRSLVLGAAALLVLPSTVHFVVKKAGQAPHPLPASTVRAMRALAEASEPGEVVLQRPGRLYPPAPVILIGRRVAYERFTPYLTQFAPRVDLERRHEDVYRFFQGADASEARAIAARVGARYVCLYERDPRPRFDLRETYDVVYEEPGAAVYRRRED